jgi:hypothetical protein
VPDSAANTSAGASPPPLPPLPPIPSTAHAAATTTAAIRESWSSPTLTRRAVTRASSATSLITLTIALSPRRIWLGVAVAAAAAAAAAVAAAAGPTETQRAP